MSATNPYAPRYHIAPEQGWINDPNGLVFSHGKWHVFYQYYEPSVVDGMQWGHAVSTDLAHWQPLPPALQPDRLGQIWSGSAVVDHHDSSGLFGGRPGMVCFFTYWDKSDHRQCQGMAYSPDGVTFRKYDGNPVIPQLRHLPGHPDEKDFRDPKVFWHPESERWIMTVAGGKLRIFSSPDLVHWSFESVHDSIETECPDLFRLPVDSDMERLLWVLSLGGRAYMLGEFDGRRFTPSTERITLSTGPDFYASQTFSDTPGGRRIMVSWLHDWGYSSALSAAGIRNPFPTRPQAGGCLTVPYEVGLRTTPRGPRLHMRAVPELDSLFAQPRTVARVTIGGAKPYGLAGVLPAADLRFTVAECDHGRCGIRIPTGPSAWVECGYDSATHSLFVDRRPSGLDTVPNYCRLYTSPPLECAPRVDLRVLLDSCSVEMFAGDGAAHMSAFVLPDPTATGVELFADTRAVVENVRIARMAGAAVCGKRSVVGSAG